MEVFTEISKGKTAKKCCLALGNFDGVHRGHQQLINIAVQEAKSSGRPAGVVTFSPHPSQVLKGKQQNLLTDMERKAELIGALGIDYLFIIPFTKRLATIEPEAFVSTILWPCFCPHSVAVGFNFTFGCQGRGTPALLSRLGGKMGFKVRIAEPVTHKGLIISSTAIRNALGQGDIHLARLLLGYWPFLEGIVVAGDQRGRELGFPTANLAVPPEIKLPADGVYASKVHLEGQDFATVVNVGRHPTFGSALSPIVEAHIINFEGDLYDKKIKLELRSFLRPERKFNGPQELVAKIKDDINRAQLLLSADNSNILYRPCDKHA